MMARTETTHIPEDPSISTTTSTPPPRTAGQSGVVAASLRARAGGYVIDMVILSAVGMIVFLIAGFVLLLSTDFAQDVDASAGDMYLFAATWLIGAVGAWTALNVALLATRAQTGGQYVVGLRLVRADGAPLTSRDVVIWWLFLNPLLFSWPMAGLAGIPMLIITMQLASTALLFVCIFVIALCFVLPLAALVAAALDSQNRALHDRVVGTVAAPAGA